MTEEQVKNIFNKLIDLAYRKNSSEFYSKKPEVELVTELYDIYNTKRKFDIYINTFSDDESLNERFNSYLRKSARTLKLVNSFNYRIFYNVDVEIFDNLKLKAKEFKSELEKKLSEKEFNFNIVYVEPENNNWASGDKFSVRVILEVLVDDETDYELVETIKEDLERILNQMVENYPMFNGYSYYLDTIENDSTEESPYDEEINEGNRIRIFSEGVESNELKWHRDRENRLVEVIDGDGWKFQFDDELPFTIKKGMSIIIPEGVYHRVIKGDGNLKVRITKIV